MKPVAVATAHACSACGLDWKKHGEKPTLEKCVELLKAEVSRLRTPKYFTEESKPTWPVVKTVGKEVNA